MIMVLGGSVMASAGAAGECPTPLSSSTLFERSDTPHCVII